MLSNMFGLLARLSQLTDQMSAFRNRALYA
jgi:hypothetical protein